MTPESVIPAGLVVLYEDDDVIAVDKPAGLLSVPGRGVDKYDSVESRVRERIAGASAIHRLDMATSGIMLLAKHKAAERHYKRQFELRAVVKYYHAIASGLIVDDKGSMKWPLIADWPNRPKQKVCWQTGKAAITDYEVLIRDAQYNQTLVRLNPITGRSHQLRVHLATLGYPIVGDDLYHHRMNNERLLLHANFLAIQQTNGLTLTLNSPVPFTCPYCL